MHVDPGKEQDWQKANRKRAKGKYKERPTEKHRRKADRGKRERVADRERQSE